MGLIGNGYRHNTTGKLFGATALDGANPTVIAGAVTARNRNQFFGEGITNKQASTPAGKKHPYAWVMAPQGGSISSFRRTNIAVDGHVTAEMGFPRGGITRITVDGSAALGLVSSVSGNTTISVTASGNLLAVLSAAGVTTITVDGSGSLEADAFITGATTVTVDGHLDLMALGYMSGTTEEAGLTPNGIANAVWNALAASNNTAGTMGNKLNTASSGGVDLNALVDAIIVALEATTIPVDTVKIKGQTITGSGTEIDPWSPA